MDLAARIQQLEDMVREAKSMPLSSSALLNREELLELIGEMRNQLPEEVKQARWVVRDREELLAKARRDSEVLVEKARAEQSRLVTREAVVEAARDEEERILADAREQAREIRLEAEDYVDAKLAQFEINLQRIQEAVTQTHETMGESLGRVQVALGESLARVQEALARVAEQVGSGREKLRGLAHPAEALASEEPQPQAEAPQP